MLDFQPQITKNNHTYGKFCILYPFFLLKKALENKQKLPIFALIKFRNHL
jgi:hypothetical protein